MEGLLLETRNLTKKNRKGSRQVRNISFSARQGEVIALVSPDGSDSTLLLEILAGQSKPSEGEVLIAGTNLYQDRTALRKKVGFVPHDLTVHQKLSVYEALDYASRLQLPKGTALTNRRKQIEEIIALLDLNDQRNLRVRALDPEQRKRVSIGAELITNPSILFLDDPVAGFTPHEEVKLMQALIKIARQGRAIILTTRSVNSLRFADRTAIILAGGYLAWFGPENEALGFFSNHPNPVEGNGKVVAFPELFDVLGNPTESEAQEWAERFRAHPAYQKYLSPAKKEKQGDILLEERPLVRLREKETSTSASPSTDKVSTVGQFFTLFARGMKVLWRDRLALAVLLIAPLLAAALDLLFSPRDMYDPSSGSSERILFSTAMLIFLVMMFAGFSWVREYQKEAKVIQRERQSTLKLIPYVLSKVVLILVFALIQALVWTGVYFLNVNIPGGFAALPYFFVTLASAALVGGLLGLLASALAKSEGGALALLFLFVIPQFLFTGWRPPASGLGQSFSTVKWINPSRMALEALVTADGTFQAFKQDACLQKPEEQQKTLSDAQKAQLCSCLGPNALTKCNYPGIRKFYQPGAERLPPDFRQQDLNNLVQNFRNKILAGSTEGFYLTLNGIIADQVTANTALYTAIRGAETLVTSDYARYRDLISADLASRLTALWITAAVLTVLFAWVLKRKDVQP